METFHGNGGTAAVTVELDTSPLVILKCSASASPRNKLTAISIADIIHLSYIRLYLLPYIMSTLNRALLVPQQSGVHEYLTR